MSFIKFNCYLFICLIIILKYPINKNDQIYNKWMMICLNDYNYCPLCFNNNTTPHTECTNLLKNIDFTTYDAIKMLNSLFGTKTIDYGTIIDNANIKNKEIVIKNLANDHQQLLIIKTDICNLLNSTNLNKCNPFINDNREILKKLLIQVFKSKDRVNVCQICPNNNLSLDRFLNVIANNGFIDEIYALIMLNISPHAILLKILENNEFSIPNFNKLIGFSLIESYEGKSLIYYYKKPFLIRLELAEQLLLAALKFTLGHHGFRFYFTDIKPENIVVNIENNKIHFIDLDNTIILDGYYNLNDSNNNIILSEWKHIDKHELIDCPGCFAYIPEDICKHHLSDINILQICQLLLYDLNGNYDNGLLHTIPLWIINNYPDIYSLLSQCVYCDNNNDCNNRIEFVNSLLDIINNILADAETYLE